MTTAHNAWILAQLADVREPDTLDSPGALFLLALQDAVGDACQAIADGQDCCDAIAETVDVVLGRSDIASQRWHIFADLAAWQEEDEWGAMAEHLKSGRLDMVATVALAQIGQRLVAFLVDEEESDDPS